MIYELAYKLNEELLKDDIILKVKEKENIMNNDKEFIVLFMSYDALKSEINDLEKYGLDTKEKQKELYKLKYQIDTLKVVIDYKNAYKEAKNFLYQIANEVFKDIDEEIKIRGEI